MPKRNETPSLYRVKDGSGFAVPGADGYLQVYKPGDLVRGDDKLVDSHRDYLEPADLGVVERATAAPGERRQLNLSGRTVADATRPHYGSAHRNANARGVEMPHRNGLPPEHPDSPASPFAPQQPAAGVVADDVPDEQNPAGKPKAIKVTQEAAKGSGARKSEADGSTLTDAAKAAKEEEKTHDDTGTAPGAASARPATKK